MAPPGAHRVKSLAQRHQHWPCSRARIRTPDLLIDILQLFKHFNKTNKDEMEEREKTKQLSARLKPFDLVQTSVVH